jgi:hypothetical protein
MDGDKVTVTVKKGASYDKMYFYFLFIRFIPMQNSTEGGQLQSQHEHKHKHEDRIYKYKFPVRELEVPTQLILKFAIR